MHPIQTNNTNTFNVSGKIDINSNSTFNNYGTLNVGKNLTLNHTFTNHTGATTTVFEKCQINGGGELTNQCSMTNGTDLDINNYLYNYGHIQTTNETTVNGGG